MEITLTTPTVLFPAITVMLLVYTNRFISISNLIRDLKKQYDTEPSDNILLQIDSLRRRVILMRNMQWLAVLTLFLSVISIFCIFENRPELAKNILVIGMVSLIASLFLSLREIHLSIYAIDLEMKSIEHKLDMKKKSLLRKIEEFEL